MEDRQVWGSGLTIQIKAPTAALSWGSLPLEVFYLYEENVPSIMGSNFGLLYSYMSTTVTKLLSYLLSVSPTNFDHFFNWRSVLPKNKFWREHCVKTGNKLTEWVIMLEMQTYMFSLNRSIYVFDFWSTLLWALTGTRDDSRLCRSVSFLLQESPSCSWQNNELWLKLICF